MSKPRRTTPTSDVVPAATTKQEQQRAKLSDLEVLPKPKRRTFTAKYKARILCYQPHYLMVVQSSCAMAIARWGGSAAK